MRKPDEIALFTALRFEAPRPFQAPGRESIEAAARRIGMHPKRTEGLLLKWRWWNYGVNVWCGWFEPEAPERLEP